MKLPAADRLRFFQDGLARIDNSGENEVRRYFLWRSVTIITSRCPRPTGSSGTGRSRSDD